MFPFKTMKDEQTPEKVEEQPKAPSVDRSAFNCPTCKGEGLITDVFEEGGLVRCPQCQGTGKV